jgi:hypothetical protein
MEIDVPDELAGRRAPRPDVGWAVEILERLPRVVPTSRLERD